MRFDDIPNDMGAEGGGGGGGATPPPPPAVVVVDVPRNGFDGTEKGLVLLVTLVILPGLPPNGPLVVVCPKGGTAAVVVKVPTEDVFPDGVLILLLFLCQGGVAAVANEDEAAEGAEKTRPAAAGAKF